MLLILRRRSLHKSTIGFEVLREWVVAKESVSEDKEAVGTVLGQGIGISDNLRSQVQNIKKKRRV
jgi:hypothetical protein